MNQFKLKHFFWVFVLYPNLPALKEENSIQHLSSGLWLTDAALISRVRCIRAWLDPKVCASSSFAGLGLSALWCFKCCQWHIHSSVPYSPFPLSLFSVFTQHDDECVILFFPFFVFLFILPPPIFVPLHLIFFFILFFFLQFNPYFTSDWTTSPPHTHTHTHTLCPQPPLQYGILLPHPSSSFPSGTLWPRRPLGQPLSMLGL